MRKLSFSLFSLLLGLVTVTACSDGGPTNPMELDLTPAYSHHLITGSGSTILYAGQDMEAGTVDVSVDDGDLVVTYNVNAGWLICETHLAVAADLAGIPQTRSGNPKVGHFPYANEFEPCIAGPYTYRIPLADLPAPPLTIAAHAVVAGLGTCTDVEDFLLTFPEMVNVCVNQEPTVGESFYFPNVTLSGGTVLDGTYGGWCIDLDTGIDPPTCFDASVFPLTSGETFAFMSNPENIDLVNWMLNQPLIATYTYGEIQRAIWYLLDGRHPTEDYSTSPWTQANVEAIIAMAIANGEGYEPGCDDYIGVVLVDTVQPIVIPKMIECECTPGDEETAWGYGERFVERGNWATYFIFAFDA